MTELHIELNDFSLEKALYCASLSNVKRAGFLCSDLSITKDEVEEKKALLNNLALFYDIDAFLGFKIAYIAPALIESYAKKMREKAFDYICVHGENVFDKVPQAQGTNFAALNAEVDILLNPGVLDDKLIEFALEKNVCLEFNLNPLYSSANAMLSYYAKNSDIQVVCANTIQSEKDFVYSLKKEESVKICPYARENDLLKKLNQDTCNLIHKLTTRVRKN